MKKLDTKGMTLIEMVMAIMIVLIASVIVMTSLSTVTNVIADSNAHKKAANEQLSALVGKKENTANVVYTDDQVVINATGLKKPIVITGTKSIASSGEDIAIGLKNFEVDAGPVNIYQDYYTKILALADSINKMTDAERKEYYREFNAKYNTSVGTDPGLSNDKFRVIVYYQIGFMELDDDIKIQCNTIFDKTHKESPPSWKWARELACRMGTGKKEILPYYIQKNGVETKETIFLYVANKSGLAVDWNTALIYDPDERCWYYKLFDTGVIDAGAYINIASLANGKTAWSDFKIANEFSNNEKWATMKMK